jgi:hypothetical protein
MSNYKSTLRIIPEKRRSLILIKKFLYLLISLQPTQNFVDYKNYSGVLHWNSSNHSSNLLSGKCKEFNTQTSV